VAKMVKKSFDAPEEIRSLHKGKIEVVDLGGVEIRRVTHEPGWRWSQTDCWDRQLPSWPPHPRPLGADSGPNGRRIRSRVWSGRCGARRVGRWGRTVYQHRLRRCSVRQTAKLSRPDGRARELKTPTPRSSKLSGVPTLFGAMRRGEYVPLTLSFFATKGSEVLP